MLMGEEMGGFLDFFLGEWGLFGGRRCRDLVFGFSGDANCLGIKRNELKGHR